MKNLFLFLILSILCLPTALLGSTDNMGYYRYPALHGKTIVFTGEGDLWKVSTAGGMAQRLTTHPGQETRAAISPDGRFVAYTASYDGPNEVYLISIDGGMPKRLTFNGDGAYVAGWTPGGEILYATGHFSTLPARQLVRLNPNTLREELVPLAQASDGAFNEAGDVLIFTRLAKQSSQTKRYKGGTAENLWIFSDGKEAVPLTADYAGTSKDPMWYEGRIYFATDRDGTMNIWSMDPDGKSLNQETDYIYFDVQEPKIDDDNIIYQVGADLYIYNIAAKTEGKVTIYLSSDFEQRREKWITDASSDLRSAAISEKGDRIALTSRGRVFTAPVKSGRFVEVTRKYGIRYKNVRFLPGSDDVLMQSDESGELEFWKAPSDGMGKAEQLSFGSTTYMREGTPSPDGKYVAYCDNDNYLLLLDTEKKTKRILDTAIQPNGMRNISWSPDGNWIAYRFEDVNTNSRIKLMNIKTGKSERITTGRLDSFDPAWSPDGKWLYILSDREFNPRTGVWGPRQPEPYYTRTTKIYMLALQKEHIWPFREKNELMVDENKDPGDDNGDKSDSGKDKKSKKDKKEDSDSDKSQMIDLEGLPARLYEVPLKSGNYGNLALTKTHLYFTDYVVSDDKSENVLKSLKISDEDPKTETVLSGIRGFDLSSDGKKVLAGKGNNIYVFDANGKAPGKLEESRVDLSGWSFIVDPVEEWKQIFLDAWRLERDYFYDPGMHGVDWKALYDRHAALLDRITDREELNNLIAQMHGELSALHIFVRGGDVRKGSDNASPASLGARLEKTEEGYLISHIYRSDPDYPGELSPLDAPDLKIKEGDIILKINGISLKDSEHPSALLRRLNRKQVRLSLKDASGKSYDEIVKPISTMEEADLRYREWEYTRMLETEEKGNGEIGYLHLRAMGSGNFTEFMKGFYPVFDRQGLIIDVRNNRGGNIDSWILEKLMRKAWMYWAYRTGLPSWNMQYAFRGHMVLLVNEATASDGEAFAEGFRRLELGKIIGTRTWGGEIWLNSGVTMLVDRGNATAAMNGVYDEDGNWLIEGHGVDPDIVVDNLPYGTFNGLDAQLEAAIRHLQDLIEKDPRPVPPPPPYPDKSFDYENR